MNEPSEKARERWDYIIHELSRSSGAWDGYGPNLDQEDCKMLLAALEAQRERVEVVECLHEKADDAQFQSDPLAQISSFALRHAAVVLASANDSPLHDTPSSSERGLCDMCGGEGCPKCGRPARPDSEDEGRRQDWQEVSRHLDEDADTRLREDESDWCIPGNMKQHCWHEDVDEPYCCHCGRERSLRLKTHVPDPEGHGPHMPFRPVTHDKEATDGG